MIHATGRLYDGKIALARAVTVTVTAAQLTVTEQDGQARSYALPEVRISARVGKIARVLYLPDGGKCESDDHEALDAIAALQGKGGVERLVHRLESSLPYALAAAVGVALIVAGFIFYGLPTLAKQTAFALPPGVAARLGQGTLEALDKTVFNATTLRDSRQQRLQEKFQMLVDDLPQGKEYRLVFRASPRIGANAFALPSGIVVVTDELVRLAHNQDEILAVLAHEIGHLEHRHALRQALQNSAAVLLLSTVTGDPFSTHALASTLPTVLLYAKYSREFETEADDYALRALQQHGIRASAFADILQRLEKQGGHEGGAASYLSSHPETAERLARFRKGG